MLKVFARMEAVVGGKIGQFHFENDATTTVETLKEMLFQFSAMVAQIEQQVKANQAVQALANAEAAAKSVEAPVEAPKE